ncbi:glycosyl transferase [Acidihalobacter ferrooxydans]|uniref:Glycosyl transferase n=1 Tax=Acidihalobacter ferrooxydans TaxID=1765967 RepID=A0A1P8UK44_9GAMM|nr:glycosyl transferase [Acidihalobacter ferrooxydans]APZ44195.1 glycosyl transferase [Acidihalobacter ferrooxydans]
MSDFHQNGPIATLHDLGTRSLASLEAELTHIARRRPLALIIPSLYSELEGPALGPMLDTIAEIPYLSTIIIGLDQADREQYLHAQKFFARLPQTVHILWHDGPRLRDVDAQLAAAGLSPGQPGKGRNVWYCLGFAATCGMAEVVAVHDADILTYDRALPAKLFYPVASDAGFGFCKGYYARSNGTHLGGRVSRLFLTPLLRALKLALGPLSFLEFLDAFRYPLSGEFAVAAGDISKLRIPANWGLEIGLLSEVYRSLNPKQVCQVDIAARYDHKHQTLSPDDATRGLSRMSREIALSIYRKLATEGVTLTPELFRALKASYLRGALDLIQHYHSDARLNGLEYSFHDEEVAVDAFSRAVIEAGEDYLATPFEPAYISNWSRVISALPDIPEALCDAVARDAA